MATQPKEQPKKLDAATIHKIARGEGRLRDARGFNDADMATMARTGYTLFTQGRYKDAETIFSGLEALDPRDAYYPNALGAIYLAQNRLDDALAALGRALALDGRHLGSRVNRGEVYLRQGKIKEAQADFEQALKVDPKCDSAFAKRAKVLLAASQASAAPAKK